MLERWNGHHQRLSGAGGLHLLIDALSLSNSGALQAGVAGLSVPVGARSISITRAPSLGDRVLIGAGSLNNSGRIQATGPAR